MSKVLITDTTMTSIANAIRYKTETSDTLLPSEMPSAIRSIQGEGTLVGIDFGTIGYEELPSDVQEMQDAIETSQGILDNWDSSTTSIRDMFRGQDTGITYMPLIDTSNVTDAVCAFDANTTLVSVPQLNLSNCTKIGVMFNYAINLKDVPVLILNTTDTIEAGEVFYNCRNLTNESLDNILKMCINITNNVRLDYGSIVLPKTLKEIMGINKGPDAPYYTTETLEALPSYQDFINAGWTLE